MCEHGAFPADGFFTAIGFCSLACGLGVLFRILVEDFCDCCRCCCQRWQAFSPEADVFQRQELRGAQMGAVPLARPAEQVEDPVTHWESLS